MKAPSLDDKTVCVNAYLTDETFGYEHWRASQFCSPADGRPAILIICKSGAEQTRMLRVVRAAHRKGTP